MAAPVTIQLQRTDSRQPWGFRLQGGRDFREPLSVKKVDPNTPAHGQLHAGDGIAAIGGYDSSQLTHAQASQMIRQAGVVLQLSIQKGLLSIRTIKPTGPVKFRPSATHTFTGQQPASYGGGYGHY